MPLNPVYLSKQEYLMSLRKAHYTRVKTLRTYDRGETPSLLTDTQKVQIAGADSKGNPASDPEVRLNVCKLANQVPVNRLDVQDISVTAEGNEELSEFLSKLIWKWWKKNRLDEGQKNIYYNAHRDGDGYGTCYYEDFPRLSANQVYDGENAGADVFYTDGDPLRPESAIKIWIAEETNSKKIRRKNIYYADRVEKWISAGDTSGSFNDADWRPLKYGDPDFEEETLVEVPSLARPSVMATVVWWTETGTERAPGMGIPVKHFRHAADGAAYGDSNIDPIVPEGQDAVNRSANDLQAAAALSGYKVTTATNFDPDISSIKVYPGAILYNSEDGTFGQLAETDLRQLIEVKDTFIKDCATLTATPLTYFNLSGVIPAEGTQQSLEMALLAKVQSDQVAFGNTWEDVIRMWLKMELTWGTELRGITQEQIDDLDINCVWESAKIRNELEDVTIAEKHQALGVPDRFIWRMLGYTEDEIEQMMVEKDVKRNVVIGKMGELIQQKEIETAQAQALALAQARTEGARNGANNGTDTSDSE